ncbi:MAG: aminoacyl-tRNA hydrolase [Candidatus Shapirobacteria bacterium]|nr:aminoacyl-tRNA hydrolase [Candidatus Shapirobacteria bacterium]
MKLIIGLGNPGLKYQNTRHNLGQKIITDFVQANHDFSFQEKKSLQSKLVEIGQGTDKIIFAISTDYMNNSGITVQKISQYYKIDSSDVYIIHDDLDLEVGEYKTQFDRGPAGHNGIKSIIEKLGTQQFHRIRIGIGKSTNNIPTEDYVLQPFSKSELDIIDSITSKIFEEIKKIINS